MKKTYILFLIVAAIAMVLAASEVRAENGFPYPAISAPRTCTVTQPDYWEATIEAGPLVTGYDESGNPIFSDVGLNAQFPLTVICDPETNKPGCPSWLGLTGPFLRWDYRFTATAAGESWPPYTFVLSVASDVEIDATSAMRVSLPGEGDTYASWPPFGRGIYEARILTFDFGDYSTPWIGYYFTPVGFDPRVASAGAVRFEDEAVTCLLAGAGRSALAPNQAAPDAQTFETPGCTVQFSVDPTGKAIPGTMQIISGGENCTIEETTEPVMIDGKEVVYVGPVQFTLPGSCKFCWVNTYGGKTCSNCTSCCIGVKSGTCQSIATVTANGDTCM